MENTPPLVFTNLNLQPHGNHWSVERAKVPGGWLVFLRVSDARTLTFVPDPNHVWDGGSVA